MATINKKTISKVPSGLTPLKAEHLCWKCPQEIFNFETTKEIELISDTIFAEPSQIYQVRFPKSDIQVRVKNLTTVNFS